MGKFLDELFGFLRKEGRTILLVLLVLAFVSGIGVCIWIICGSRLTPRESALLSVILTILSMLATWVVAHLYGESQHSQAIKEVQEVHRANLRTYALKAAEKVNNLSNELNRLSVYLGEELEEELESDSDDTFQQAVQSKDDRIESAVHILETLKSMNDTALSDWEGVIGEELDKQREERRETEEELRDLIAQIESIVELQRHDVMGHQEDTDTLRSELHELRADLRKVIAKVGVTSIPSRSERRKRHKLSVACPSCGADINYRQREYPRTTKAVSCNSCGGRFVSWFSEEQGFHLKPRILLDEGVLCPNCESTSQIQLDSCPGTAVDVLCSSCGQSFRAVRSHDGVLVRKATSARSVAPKREFSEELLEEVRSRLPTQPWPKGIHRSVAQELDVPPTSVNRAIQVLIQRRVFNPQIGGVVYQPIQQEGEFNTDSSAKMPSDV